MVELFVADGTVNVNTFKLSDDTSNSEQSPKKWLNQQNEQQSTVPAKVENREMKLYDRPLECTSNKKTIR